MTPSGFSPVVAMRQSAMSSFRASATIIVLRVPLRRRTRALPARASPFSRRRLPAAPPFLITGHAGHYQNSFAGRNLGCASSAGQWPQLPAVRRHALSVWDGLQTIPVGSPPRR